MEFREVTKEERLELIELQARSFFFAYDRKKYAEEIERGAPWRAGFGVFEGGRLAAGLDLLPFDAWFDGNVVGMGGVGGVASEPACRGGGNVRALMEGCLNLMHERGDVFSFLYPFSSRFYRKFGYESCLRLLRVRAPLEPLRGFRQPGRAERFVPGEGGSDPGPIVEIYNDFASRRNLAVDREGWRWRALLEQDPLSTRRHAFVWRDEGGRPAAYVLFKAEQVAGEAEEMRVLEACWRDDPALRGLLGFMGGFCSNLKTLVWEMPGGLAPDLIWPECRNIEMKLDCHGMCRVVNAQKALRLMRKPTGSGGARVAVSDPAVAANAGVYKIDWEDGEGTVRRVRGGDADLACSEAALAQLVTGYLSLGEARFRDDVVVNSKEDELGKLFVKKDVYIADKF